MVARGRGLKLLAAALAASVLMVPLNPARAGSTGEWAQTTSYPIQVAGDSCVGVSARVYCVGGFDGSDNSQSAVYYATLSPSGIGTWSSAPSYPTSVDSASCVNAISGVYCVGGEDASTVLGDVYYATFSSQGLGPWSRVAAYPSPVAAPSCVFYSGYVYCVGGFDANGDEVNSTYYASVSSGLTSWSKTTPYPQAVDSESCVVYTGEVFCLAGETESGSSQNNPVSDVYYAPLSPSGIGRWTAALSYPTALAALSCAPYSGEVYCVGGFDAGQMSEASAYVGTLSASGVGSWSAAGDYPVPVDTSSCVAALGYVYCVAGLTEASGGSSVLASSYFASTSLATPEFPATVAIPVVFAIALLVVASLSRKDGKRAPPRRV